MRGRVWLILGVILGVLVAAGGLPYLGGAGRSWAETAVRLVGTAAGPLAGDDLSLSLLLAPGARASLGATGASLAQGRDGGGAASLCSGLPRCRRLA